MTQHSDPTSLIARGGRLGGLSLELWLLIGRLLPREPSPQVHTRQTSEVSVGSGGQTWGIPCTDRGQGWKMVLSGASEEGWLLMEPQAT